MSIGVGGPDCSNCDDCLNSFTGCLAGRGDDDFVPITETIAHALIKSEAVTVKGFDRLLKKYPRLKKYKFFRKYIESKAALPKFIDALDFYLKENSGKIPNSHYKKLCEFLGQVNVTVKFPIRWAELPSEVRAKYEDARRWGDTIKFPLSELINVFDLAEEVEKIATGSRADVIYESEDFADNFMKKTKDQTIREIKERS